MIEETAVTFWKQTSPWRHKTIGMVASIFLSEKSQMFLKMVPLTSPSCRGHQFLFLPFSPPFLSHRSHFFPSTFLFSLFFVHILYFFHSWPSWTWPTLLHLVLPSRQLSILIPISPLFLVSRTFWRIFSQPPTLSWSSRFSHQWTLAWIL